MQVGIGQFTTKTLSTVSGHLFHRRNHLSFRLSDPTSRKIAVRTFYRDNTPREVAAFSRVFGSETTSEGS